MKRIKSIIGVLCLAFALLTACGDSSSSTVVIDYGDDISFEEALNNGENLEGKIVQFKALELHPQSARGYNIWAGEHLNFISSRNPDVKEGDVLTVKATTIESSLGSWFITYEKVDNAEVGETTIFATNPENNDINGAENLTETSETESNGGTATFSVGSSSEKKDLEVKDYGWYISPSDDTAYVHFCAMINNPNQDLVAEFPKVNVTVRNGDGSILATEEQVGSLIMPNDTITLCGMMSVPMNDITDDAQITFDAGYSELKKSSSMFTNAKTTDFEISNVSERNSDETYITGEITNKYSEDIDSVNLALVLRKDGEIVFVENTFLDDLKTGKAIPFQFQFYNELPEHDTIEVSAMIW